jgi:predicted N-formylglutamate amidohydrolase
VTSDQAADDRSQAALRANPAAQTGMPVVLTCEHGGNRVPKPWQPLFADAAEVLASHRGWDIGALKLARRMATALQSPLFSSTVTRLLVELNRSQRHRQLFSEFTSHLDAAAKQQLLQKHWTPYRQQVEQHIASLIKQHGQVMHLSVHSFTPIFNGTKRRTDIGLLFDPRRSNEASLCRHWQSSLKLALPNTTVHRNAPYRGISDGFVPALRKQFGHAGYIGVELEVNQRYFQSPSHISYPILADQLVRTFQQSLTTVTAGTTVQDIADQTDTPRI